MAQGKTKGLQAKASSSRHAKKAAAAPKKGLRNIPPKKEALVKQATMKQVRYFGTIAGIYCAYSDALEIVCQNQQVYRETDGVRSIFWQTDDYEKRCTTINSAYTGDRHAISTSKSRFTASWDRFINRSAKAYAEYAALTLCSIEEQAWDYQLMTACCISHRSFQCTQFSV